MTEIYKRNSSQAMELDMLERRIRRLVAKLEKVSKLFLKFLFKEFAVILYFRVLNFLC